MEKSENVEKERVENKQKKEEIAIDESATSITLSTKSENSSFEDSDQSLKMNSQKG